ncbi:uncharacterized protein LAESUDRAFT_809575 [Laetiporus sulphureus 93-53]|uniref:Uncharacterized protein n=1 Tax=Laetiporus sulphureus 93-53 TaxID=1314785 RepID=A0A165GPL2_9APHY|nr:uncharacterized protein LAESUDRAFT_809575 [Laetiporus sulphureus 93-53]KZT10632.1 hypothetical protein LAESUDRAFT_809575 [Laetiporus sulphureus 93-53]
MPPRLVTQSIADRLEIDGFTGGRSNTQHPFKRRKTEGTNSRIDRMMETVNVLYTSPTSSSSSRYRRPRTFSSSSASAVSYDMPKTPVDAYSGYDEGRLGKEFSVLKMPKSDNPAAEESALIARNDPYNERRRRAPTQPVPTWLSKTLSTLDPRHPLRVLVRQASFEERQNAGEHHDIQRTHARPEMNAKQPEHSDGSVFAFCPPSNDTLDVSAPLRQTLDPSRALFAGDPSLFESGHDGTYQQQDALLRSNRSSQEYALESVEFNSATSTLLPPFSTPGPAAYISIVTPAKHVRPLDLAQLAPDLPDELTVSALNDNDNAEDVFVPFSKPGPQASSRELSDSVTPMHVAAQSNLLLGRSRGLEPVLASLSPLKWQCNGSQLHPGQNSEAQYGHRTSSSSVVLDGILASSPSHPPAVHSINMLAMPSLLANDYDAALTELSGKHSESIDAIPFSMPGPTHSVPLRQAAIKIYFDSPAEDPSMSDPTEEDDYVLPLDYDAEALDFKWEKFDRGRTDSEPQSISGVSNTNADLVLLRTPDLSTPRTPVIPDENETSSSSLGFSPCDANAEPYQDNGTWILPPHSQVPGTTKRRFGINDVSREHPDAMVPPPTPPRPVFAPAPGIFLSPLRGEKGVPERFVQLDDGQLSNRGSSGHHVDRQLPYKQSEQSAVAAEDDSGQSTSEVQTKGSVAEHAADREENKANGVSQVAAQRPVQHTHDEVEEHPQDEQAQAEMFEEYLADEDVDDANDGVREEASNDVHDELQPKGSQESQESHDTIESWTDT